MTLQVTRDIGQPAWRRDGPRFALVAWMIATIAVVATSVGATIVVSIVATVRASLGGERSAERLGEIAKEAIGSGALAWIVVIASQVALFACVWLACRVLQKPVRERLGPGHNESESGAGSRAAGCHHCAVRRGAGGGVAC